MPDTGYWIIKEYQKMKSRNIWNQVSGDAGEGLLNSISETIEEIEQVTKVVFSKEDCSRQSYPSYLQSQDGRRSSHPAA